MDASGSMTDRSHPFSWLVAVRVATAVVEAAPPDTAVELVIFTSKPVGISRGRTAVLDQLKVMQTNMPDLNKPYDKRTAITDTLAAMLTGVRAGPGGEIAYVLSDGGQNVERYNVERTIDGLVQSNIRLFTFVVKDDRPPRTEEERIGPEMMQKIAAETGGLGAVFPSDQWRSPGDLTQLAGYQYAQMARFYELDLRMPQEILKRTGWKLEVVEDNQRRPTARVSYPRHLPPCSSLTAPSSNSAQRP